MWGSIIVAGAVFALVVLLDRPLNSSVVLWSLIGFGAALVLAAVITGAVRAVSGPTPSETDGSGHPPIG